MKTLLLMRHADAAPGEADRDRPLTADGTAAALAVGHWLDAEGWLADLALASDARRTRETLAGLAPALRVQPEAHFDAALYRADAGELLDHIRACGGAARCLLVIGHNPAIADLADMLGRRGNARARTALARGFPPGAVAAFDIACDDWDALDGGCAELTRFATPGMLPASGG